MSNFEDLERLYAWVDEIPLSRPKKSLPRDFSDGGAFPVYDDFLRCTGNQVSTENKLLDKFMTRPYTKQNIFSVLMAELCKNQFPKVVDLHNYPPANSLTAKVINWETLNRKVFSKLQIRVTTELIHQIAAGVPGAVESVLLAVKQKADSRHKQLAHAQSHPGSRGDYTNADNFQADLGILSEIKKLKEEVHLKNSTINVLNQKVTHLENLIQMKDKRLRELTVSVERLQTKEKLSQDSFRTTSS